MSFPGMQTRPGAGGQDEYAGLDPQQQAMVKMVCDRPREILIEMMADQRLIDASGHGVVCG